MDCPICKVELKMSERQGIEIDYCPQCRGVWLDRGELDKIIERSSAQAGEPDGRLDRSGDRDERREHRRDDDDYDKHHRRKRKSFLGELFDFD